MIRKISLALCFVFLYSGCELTSKPKMVYVENPPIVDENQTLPPEDENQTLPPEDENQTLPSEDEDIEVVIKESYREDASVNIDNPDRGLYDSNYDLNIEEEYNRFEDVRKNGYTLAYAPIDLEDYLTTDKLPDKLLKTIEKNLSDASSAGVNLIFRVKYSSAVGQDDPTKEIAISHLNQLKAILQKHKDSISVVQAGVIGAWGEWHDLTGDYADTDANYKENRRAIIDKLIEIFPDKYIQIRTPMHKELLYGDAKNYEDIGSGGKITPSIAFSNDTRAKIGHHNDCFLADDTDRGTYASNDINFWQKYVINDTKFAPVGGETCRDSSYLSCDNTLSQMKRYQYSYMNGVFKKGVIDRWKDEKCYQTIRENLGYRLVAKELSITHDHRYMKIKLSVQNRGFASPYIKSNMNFILDSGSKKYTYHIPVDSRTLYVNETKELIQGVDMSRIESGEYCLYLQIGSKNSAIKLSNKNLWDSKTKTNRLKCDIVIDD
ncbi:hypothetical protein MNB_SV-6-1317 [hydrothermal vent metagenome]|uniref:DUF4832 domain-containing protein n=1 Tax=hydrothermal vent metagenome TaxID=652676 RepID=A0A1W1BEF5_9ZZZZ